MILQGKSLFLSSEGPRLILLFKILKQVGYFSVTYKPAYL